MLTTAAATLLALSTVVPATGADDLDEPAPPTRVEVVTVNGSGCPAGTANVSTGTTSFEVDYRAFYAQAGGGADAVDSRRNCQLGVRVSLPPGYTYGLSRMTYDGFTHLEAGARALHRVDFHFQGSSSGKTLEFPYSGPMNDEWRSTYRPTPGEVVYSPCGDDRNLNINAELRVDLGTSDRAKRSLILAESSRGTVRAKYDLVTKRC
ncbi:DUF4360 domain-containing protein [Saccharothrix australiensis]|uniref:Uncharacterized protein DUF4360 n=1 Tax=Saccharothrix australiensis TaxID=2072 RepID=A0A495VYM5_9PSEU|nr:DUF4360 domain-containing protein [Saccharothrix australiensis]RKT54304.1 uncharacterized protein DUF4360 [Saccharothrix australiensis]